MKARIDASLWAGWRDVMTVPPSTPHDETALRLRQQRRACEEEAYSRLQVISHELATGRRGSYFSEETVRDVFRKISPKRGIAARQIVADWLARGLERGRAELKWIVAPPPEIVRLPRERSLHHETAWLDEPTYQKLEQAFVDDLVSGQALGEMEQAGRLTHSAIACGGLWAPEKRQAFAASRIGAWRCNGERVYLSNEFIQIADVVKEANAGGEGQIWRWQADAVTGRLVSRYSQGRNPATPLLPAPIEVCLRAYWKQLQIPRPSQPRSIAEFVRMAVTHWSAYLPPFLSDIARGRDMTTDVPEAVLSRLRLGSPVKHHLHSESRAGIAAVGLQLNAAQTNTQSYRGLRDQHAFVTRAARNLAALGRKPRRDAIRTTLEEVVQQSAGIPGRFELLMISWLYDLVVNGGLSGGRLTTSSLKRYFSAARYPLLAAFQGADLASLDAGSWVHRLQDAIDRSRDRMTPRQVLSFAAYLLRCPDGPRFEIEELEFEDDAMHSRATLMSPSELERALRRLAGDDRLVEMQRLASVLIFYCGMRPDDVVHLRLCDTHGVAMPEILVRPNKDYDPKSLSSVRRVPVMALLPEKWAKQFAVWIRRRVAEVGREDSEDLVFALPSEPRQGLTRDLLQDPATDALRDITGDGSITFYSLRHGFATITLLRLLAADIPHLLPQSYALFREECFKPEACRAYKRALGLDSGMVAVGGLRVQASLMGHLNTRTTRKHYLHLMDVLLAQCLDLALGKRFPESVFKSLSDCGSHWYELRKRLYRDSEASWDLEQLSQYWLKDTTIASETIVFHKPRHRPQQSKSSSAVAKRLPYGLLPAILVQLFQQRLQPESVGRSMAVPCQLVERVAVRALSLCGLEPKVGLQPDQEMAKKLKHLISAPPRIHRDKQDASEVFGALEKHPLRRSAVAWLNEIGKTGNPGNLMTVRFSDPAGLRRLIGIYQHLSIARKRLFLILDPHQDADDGDITRRMNYWRAQTGIPIERIKVEARSSRWWRHAPPDAPQGYVMLYVQPKASKPDPKTGQIQLARSYGVRYAMHLALLNEPA